MAEFGSCKGKVLKFESGLLAVPFASAGSGGYHAVIIGHLVLDVNFVENAVGRSIWAKRDDILKAEVIPLATLTYLMGSYGPTH